MKKVNLGCGQFKKEGFINIDGDPAVSPDILFDLDVFPYPFKESSIDLIEADHLFEHLKDPFLAMKEVHRILKDRGRIIIRVPHFSRGFTHSDHKRGFDVWFPKYFDPKWKGGYMGFDFISEGVRLTWFSQPYLKSTVLSRPICIIGNILGTIFDFFANLSPTACSRIWCFWVGGFEQLEYRLIAKKKM